MAATFGLDADECAIQRALLGRAGPECPPPPAPAVEVAEPEPPVATVPDPVPAAAAPPAPKRSAPPPPPPPPVVAHPPPVAAAVVDEPEPRRADFLILFQFGSATLTENSEALLKRIAAVMRAGLDDGARFRVVGHTDAVGAAAGNLALSRRRAEAVRNFLITAGGVPADRLEAEGRGEAEPADSEHPNAAANRRVEIIVLPPVAPAGRVPSAEVVPGRAGTGGVGTGQLPEGGRRR